MVLLPPSGADSVKLTSQTTDSQYIDENNDSIDDSDNLEKMEQDEVARDVTRKMKREYYENEVEDVTEKTFNESLKSAELVVLMFYVTWDVETYVVRPVFDGIASKIGRFTC